MKARKQGRREVEKNPRWNTREILMVVDGARLRDTREHRLRKLDGHKHRYVLLQQKRVTERSLRPVTLQ